ncbi:hypothetical protein CS0771_60030 [Catellatospora sp. IY07-71]|uniref:NlpC/P60 family protein n=1 Tax=Catellatospora sp. IY07-71 TaxID=2728827 RepID=UPI001BB3F542|nr:NlpC/P60 family protein [Catellatospora sp. IY07-71]BCJ76459.1 hypothetical protein CS0771_60030 [Catellatospora sp. IY07-71]
MAHRRGFRGRTALILTTVTGVLAGAGALALALRDNTQPDPAAQPQVVAQPSATTTDGLSFRRLQDPPRTEVVGQDGKPVAVLTDGSRTVQLAGPRRTFAEPRFTNAKIKSGWWVRLAPAEWTADGAEQDWFRPWLRDALADRSPDVLAVAMEYTYGANPQKKNGLQIAGDAAFGPLSEIDPDGRAENSDFYDYLGVSWKFSDGKKEQPSATHLRSLDCSGFLRMVYGYRLGYPLRGTNTPGVGLPRRAYAMAEFGPGAQLMPNTGKRAKGLDRLLPGDLLFFNAGPVQGTNIEHSGMYMGVDDRGHHRFISSRTTANGPTFGDLGGESILDGTGYWAVRLRTARRI